MDCRFFKTDHCHSCELLSLTYGETLNLKEKKLRELFSGINLSLRPTVSLTDVAASRNKAKLAVFGIDESSIQFGFYNSKSEFKALEQCPLHMEGINELLPILKEKLKEYKIIPYSIAEKKGELKYVIISKGQAENDFLVRFTIRSKESLDRLKKLATILEITHPYIKVITANIQPEHKAIFEGDEEIILTKNESIHHQFGDVKLTIGPRSFFQVTPEIAGKLYESAGKILADNSVKSFLDLFCGVGAFSYFAAKNCPVVLGVEISKE
ncbi:MAG: hypothetical protein K2Q18_01415, partial [Bdellovibrionales bacterium]|nr:hypothetical protein [Bdellovibrionales bacterium]